MSVEARKEKLVALAHETRAQLLKLDDDNAGDKDAQERAAVNIVATAVVEAFDILCADL